MVHEPTILLRTRFEAKAFRQISHPNVVRVHGSGIRADSVPWMAMEWLEGFTIGEILENRRRVPLRWAVEIVRDLCRGLRAIHEYGAIHRDIKPSNVHFGVDGVTRALDLGAAKSKEPNVHLTTTGSQVGTLPFMAPEQLDNTMGLDHRVDLWAATVVLYMLMTGVHPFAVGGDIPANKIKLGFSILTDPHRPLHEVLPSAPRFFGELIDRGLAKDPAERHRSAEELAQILTAALDYLTATTGHAEPLRSLAEQLAGEAKPVSPRRRTSSGDPVQGQCKGLAAQRSCRTPTRRSGSPPT
jgi:serine/threonine-protein kinase